MKARTLPRPWPLLADEQDPEALEARVAFHLHRLGIRGRRLAKALGNYGLHRATALTQARTLLTHGNVNELAMLVGCEHDDLARPLTEDEHREWYFYRISARHARFVWSSALAAWSHAGYSNKQAAQIMGLSTYLVANNARQNNDAPSPLTFPSAARLSTALTLPLGTDTFLPEGERFEATPFARCD